MTEGLSIGEVAKRTGLPAKTIRYYEDTGLLPAAQRAPNGYRRYDEKTVHRLHFVKRARDLGFSLEDTRNLLALWSNERRASADVRHLAQKHLATIERKLEELEGMRQTLATLIRGCHGDQRPDCPILEDLAGSDDRG